MALAQDLALDGKGLAVHRLGTDQIAAVSQHHGEATVANGGVGVTLTHDFLPDCLSLAVHLHGAGQIARARSTAPRLS